MYTIKDFIKKKISVCLLRGEKRQKFLQACEDAGIKWPDGSLPTDIRFGTPEGFIYLHTGMWYCSDLQLAFSFYEDISEYNGYNVVSAADFEFMRCGGTI